MDEDYPSTDDDEIEEVTAPPEDGEEEDDDEAEIPEDVETVQLSNKNQAQYMKVVSQDEMLTSDFLTGNMMAGVLSVRTEQISRNNQVILPPGVETKFNKPEYLAIQELLAGTNPIVVQIKRGEKDGMVIVERRPVRGMKIDVKSLESIMPPHMIKSLCTGVNYAD